MQIHMNPKEANIAAAALVFALLAPQEDVSDEVKQRINDYIGKNPQAELETVLLAPGDRSDEWREMMGVALLAYMQQEPYNEDESIICSEIITLLEVSGMDGKVLREEDDPKPDTVPQGFTVTINKEISAADICNLFVSSFEGGSNFWLLEANYANGEMFGGVAPEDSGVIWWGSDNIYGHPNFKFTARFYEDADSDEEAIITKTLTRDDVQRALETMAKEYPDHFNDIITEGDDATTADVFMQLVVLGEVVYG